METNSSSAPVRPQPSLEYPCCRCRGARACEGCQLPASHPCGSWQATGHGTARQEQPRGDTRGQ